MAVFLCVTASVAVVMGLVGLEAGSPLWLRRAERKRGPLPRCEDALREWKERWSIPVISQQR